MSRLKISIAPPSELGALYPRYDEEANILEIQSRVMRECPFGINVDNIIILDVDSDRMLANCDLIMRSGSWEPDPSITWPHTVGRGSIVLAETTLATKYFLLPVRVTCDPSRRLVHIAIGEQEQTECWQLSNACTALVADDVLVGLVARLDGE